MDAQLRECINRLNAQNENLDKVRTDYLLHEAQRKHFEATLIQEAQGKSSTEKTTNAQATTRWLDFHKELARLEARFEFEKLKYEILDKEFLATYAEYKMDDRGVRRGA